MGCHSMFTRLYYYKGFEKGSEHSDPFLKASKRAATWL